MKTKPVTVGSSRCNGTQMQRFMFQIYILYCTVTTVYSKQKPNIYCCIYTPAVSGIKKMQIIFWLSENSSIYLTN